MLLRLFALFHFLPLLLLPRTTCLMLPPPHLRVVKLYLSIFVNAFILHVAVSVSSNLLCNPCVNQHTASNSFCCSIVAPSLIFWPSAFACLITSVSRLVRTSKCSLPRKRILLVVQTHRGTDRIRQAKARGPGREGSVSFLVMVAFCAFCRVPTNYD